MNNPTAPSTKKYGLWFVKAFTLNAVPQEPVTGEFIMNLFFSEITSEKNLTAANLIVTVGDTIDDNSQVVIDGAKANGRLERLEVSGAEIKAQAAAIIAVSKTTKSRKVLAEGEKTLGSETRSIGASKVAFIAALQAAKAAAPAPAAAKK